jgi:isopenicillin N synthase-like dioxygenase
MVLEKYTLFSDFTKKSRFHVLELLACLSDAIGLEGEARFESFHRDDLPSNSSMTFHRYPMNKARNVSNVGHNKHTDVDTIAFLFAQQWGLQVPSVSGKGWDYVRPKPGHAICNVGDSLRFLSGFRLHAALHRVVPVAEMEFSHRYSIAYFTRPVDGTVFIDSEGRKIQAEEWFEHKFDMLRASHAEQRANSVLTGGIEDVTTRSIVYKDLTV